MADFWKSQPRKQCEFCKCWIADNKPSIAFHENGKKHKENVAKKLSEISKKSAQDAKHQVQIDKEMRKMEEAALKAYMKDIEENADFTSQLVREGLQERQKAAEDAALKQAEAKMAKEAAKQREKIDHELKRKKIKEKAETVKWREARSDEGYSYYWHPDTNETKWEPPEDGYLTLADQKLLEEPERTKVVVGGFKKKGKGKGFAGQKRKGGEPSGNPVKKKVEDANTAAPSKSSDTSKKVAPEIGPAPKPNPYGLWKPIEKKVIESVDLQLPRKEQFVEVSVPCLSEDRPRIKFQEKKISKPLLDDEPSTSQTGFIGFKKKGNFRGNTRQRLDTDD